MTTLLAILAGALLVYSLYLRLQLYINQRIINAFQSAAVVVPPARSRSDLRPALVTTGMLLLAAGAVFSTVAK